MKKFKRRLSVITIVSILTCLLTPMANAATPLKIVNSMYGYNQQPNSEFHEESEVVQENQGTADTPLDFTEPSSPSNGLNTSDEDNRQADEEKELLPLGEDIQQTDNEEELLPHDEDIQQTDNEETLDIPVENTQLTEIKMNINGISGDIQKAESEDELTAFIADAAANDELHEIEIMGNIHLTSSILIQDQQNIKIYSNGTATLTTDAERHFEVNGTLTLSDITLDGQNAPGGIIVRDGRLILNTGAIIKNCSTPTSGGGIFAENSSIEINGGTIIGNTSGRDGGGIFATGSSEIVLYTGSIRENSLTSNARCGGGIALADENSSLTMHSGEIADNKTNITANSSSGGGIYMKGTFNMYEGTISGNESTAYGGGVHIYNSGSMHMHGGKISNNIVHELQTPGALTPCGGGIAVGTGGQLTIDAGIIEYNKSNQGGGVFVGYPSAKDTIFNFNGGTIRANTAKAYGGGIMAQYTNTIVTIDGGTIGGENPEDANKSANGSGLFIMQGTVNMKSGNISGNQATATGGGIYNYGGQLQIDGGTVTANSAPQAGGIMVIGINSGNLAVFKMTSGKINHNQATESQGGGILLFSNVDADISGGEIKENHGRIGGGIYIGSGITLPISKVQITGNTSGGSGAGIFVIDSTINMDSGNIENNQAGGDGGGVYISGGTFNMYDGKINNNTATNDKESVGAGGVYSTSNTFIIHDGEISGNTADYSGGGMLIDKGIVTMNGGKISGNTVKKGSGAGVYNGEGSLFTLNTGAEISGNIATSGSGAGMFNLSTINMTGGEISGNTATSYGGGVINGNGDIPAATFNMTGGKISGNTAAWGGGVFNIDTFNMTDGEISDNTAGNGGGGMQNNGETAIFIMTDSKISENTASYGGGVVNGGTFKMIDSEISDNSATGMGGGGVYNVGTFTADDSTITSNSAASTTTDSLGGGVLNGDSATFTMSGGAISHNTAVSGGGAYLGDSTILQMENADINGNTASKNGGGLYISEDSQLTSGEKVSFTDNQAGTEGGAVYSEKYDVYAADMNTVSDYSNLTFDSDTVFDNNTANALYQPPGNAFSFSNLGFEKNSFSNLVGHPLNNFDINFVFPPAVTLYSVTYHSNDGIATPKTKTYKIVPGGSHTIKGNSDAEIGFTRENYTFAGWNSLANGQGTDYTEGLTLDDINQNITLYAQWKKSNSDFTYTVTYDANGGKGNYQDSNLTLGLSYRVKTLFTTGITRSGYTFVNWNTEKDGNGTAYTPQDIFSISGSITLYAQWKKDDGSSGGSGGGGGGGGGSITSYTVTYDANGGDGSHKDSGLSSGTVYTVKTQWETGITYDDYIFINWNTKKDGSGIAYNPQDTFKIKGNVTLYAQWEPKPSNPLNTEDHVAYIVGYPDGTVRPNANITRGETATIFFRLLTESFRNEHLSKENNFWDVTSVDWFNVAVSTMSHAEILIGYEDGSFGGDKFITRAEFAAIAARFEDGNYTGEDKFSDIGTHWANEYINLAAEKGWVIGYPDGTFKPDQYITRAEAMTLINHELEQDDFEEVHTTPDEIREEHPDMKTWIDNNPDQWYYAAVQEATNSHEYERDEDRDEIWLRILPVPNWAALER